jgi:hypothetical protein
LDFAELVARIGAATVGDCLENQRTIAGPETFDVSSKASLKLDAGYTVQRTTNRVLAWSPVDNITSFYDELGIRSLGPRGYVVTTWDELLASSSAPATPTPRPWSDRDEAGKQCSEIWTTALVSSIGIGMSQAEMDRRKAQADAIYYLCNRAADDDGSAEWRAFGRRGKRASAWSGSSPAPAARRTTRLTPAA